MGIARYDHREFMATYFALRLGLIFTSLIVLSAPALVVLHGDPLPPTISDSWYTDARSVFVLGLAAGGCLLVVVRGDTLTEQTLLNVAGGLGLVVAGAACWPKDSTGAALENYDPVVMRYNAFSVEALLFVSVLVWITRSIVPKQIVGTGWHTGRSTTLALEAIYPALTLVGIAAMVFARTDVAEHAHGPAATAMFALLGCVALLRTSRGVKLLEKLGDTPVDASLSAGRVNGDTRRNSGYDRTYSGIAVGMLGVVVIDVILTLSNVKPGWVIAVETSLLLLFGAFWGVQTREAWQRRNE